MQAQEYGDGTVSFALTQDLDDGVCRSKPGDSNSRQVFAFDPLPARYLRYVGFGNSQNSFNSVTELLGHGK